MGHTEIVKILLNDPRIDINATNIPGATAFSACCSKFVKNNSTLDIIELLLKHPNIDPTIPSGFSVEPYYSFIYYLSNIFY